MCHMFCTSIERLLFVLSVWNLAVFVAVIQFKICPFECFFVFFFKLEF